MLLRDTTFDVEEGLTREGPKGSELLRHLRISFLATHPEPSLSEIKQPLQNVELLKRHIT